MGRDNLLHIIHKVKTIGHQLKQSNCVVTSYQVILLVLAPKDRGNKLIYVQSKYNPLVTPSYYHAIMTTIKYKFLIEQF